MDFLWFILIGLVAGWLASLFVKGGGYGSSATSRWRGRRFARSFIFHLFGFTGGSGLIGSLIVSTFGAVLLLPAALVLHSSSRLKIGAIRRGARA